LCSSFLPWENRTISNRPDSEVADLQGFEEVFGFYPQAAALGYFGYGGVRSSSIHLVCIQVPGRVENPVAGFMSSLPNVNRKSRLESSKAENGNAESASKLPRDDVIASDVQSV